MISTKPKTLAAHVIKFNAQFPQLFEQVPDLLSDFADRVRAITPHFFTALAQNGIDALRSEMLNVQAQVCWLNFGLPVFQLTEDLLAGCALTDPGSVSVEDVNLPFGTFAIALPPGFWSMASMGLDGKREPITMVMIHRYAAQVGPKQEIRPSIMIHMIARDGTTLWDRVPWPRNGTFGPWLDNTDISYALTDNVNADEHQLQLTMRRVLINLVLYISERGRGRKVQPFKTRKQRKRSPKRAAKFAKPVLDVWIIGHEVKLDKALIGAARACVGGKGSGWTITKRFVRRGHRRRQPCGPGSRDRKWIWIEPTWVGPKDGERLTHLYTGVDDDG